MTEREREAGRETDGKIGGKGLKMKGNTTMLKGENQGQYHQSPALHRPLLKRVALRLPQSLRSHQILKTQVRLRSEEILN